MSSPSTPGFGWADLRRADGDPRPPGALVVCVASVVLFAWLALGTVFDAHEAVLTVGGLLIATVAAWWLTVPASLGLGIIAFLVLDGFAQNSLGQLSWDGTHDLMLLLGALGLPALSAELGFEVLRERRRARESVGVHHDGRLDPDG